MNYDHVSPESMTKYLASELDPEKKKEIEIHFAVCPECAAKLDEQRRFEQAAAQSYARDFSGRIEKEDAQKMDDMIQQKIMTETESSGWKKRIRSAALVQGGTILLMAVMLTFMIVYVCKVSPDKKTAVPTAQAGTPNPKQAQGKTAEPFPSPAVTAVQSQTEPAEPQQTAAKEEKTVPVPEPLPKKEEKTASVPEPQPKAEVKSVLNPGLVRFFQLDQIPLTVNYTGMKPDQPSAICVRSPFEKDVYVLTAFCGSAEKEILIHAAPDAACISRLGCAAQKNVRSAALRTEKPVLLLATVQVMNGNEPPFHVLTKDEVKDFAQAPAFLRLAAILHAAGNPKLVLIRDTRAKMLEELDKLLQNECAGDQAVMELRKKMGKVR